MQLKAQGPEPLNEVGAQLLSLRGNVGSGVVEGP